MNINWFKDPNNIIYMNIDDFSSSFKRELNMFDLKKQIEEFRANPSPMGKVIRSSQTSIKLFIPKLSFQEPLENEENVWVYFGKNHPSYCLDKTEPWRDKSYFYFSHKECEFFPCHSEVDADRFNCIFCFCPLYCLGERCGGNYSYCGNIKDCSQCILPHLEDSYGYIMSKFEQITESIREL